MLGYGACPHWTISRSLLGLPRMGPFDAPQSRLPLRLIAESTNKLGSRPAVVEIHPGLAAWLWCRDSRDSGASWLYKGTSAQSRRIRDEMWEIILKRSGFEDALPQPETDDEFDAAVGYILGRLFTDDARPKRCYILCDREHGAFLLPRVPRLADVWVRWKTAKSRHDRQTGQQTESASGAADSASSALGSMKEGVESTAAAAREAFSRAKDGSRQAFAAAAALSEELLATVQGVLASSLSVDLNALLAATVKGSATIYDKAMDAEYLNTFIGGGNHRMFDGGHTIGGAFQAVRDASPDDSLIEEALGFLEAIFKDLTTAKGLPLANWDKATYDQVATHLQSNFGISKEWGLYA